MIKFITNKNEEIILELGLPLTVNPYSINKIEATDNELNQLIRWGFIPNGGNSIYIGISAMQIAEIWK